MWPWRKACTVVSVLLLAIAVLLNWFGSPITSYQMERQVEAYLLQQGYEAQKLADVHTVYNRKDQTKYTVVVRFTDNPEQTYYYSYDANGEIRQMEHEGR